MTKQKFTIFILYFGLYLNGYSQKEDHHWILGYDLQPLSIDTLYGNSSINFNYDPVKIYHETKHEINMAGANTSICDKNGKLTAYSNGQVIMNCENGYIADTINYSYELPWQCRQWETSNQGNAQKALLTGMRSLQGTLLHNINDMYYNFYVTFDGCNSVHYKMSYSKFAKNESNIDGEIIEKDITVLIDSLNSSIQAIRHSNGRDWWVVVFTNGFEYIISFLVTTESVVLQHKLSTGYTKKAQGTIGQMVFSPDGKQLAIYTANTLFSNTGGGFCLWDFDRCSGTIQNMRNVVSDHEFIANGIAFSGDSRYLYVANGSKLWQYDTKTTSIVNSQHFVAEIDSFYYVFPEPNPNNIKILVNFSSLKLGPDGRLYVFPSAGTQRYISVMDFPHENHDLVGVRQHSIYMPRLFTRTVPNIPEFRLGPDDGSSCDTLGLDNHPIAKFRYEPDSVQHKKIRFTDLSYFRPETWRWDFGDGSPQVTERYPFHTYSASGTYEVCLTVSNENSSNMTCCTITIGTSNSDDAKLKADITLFPNPVSDILQVTLGEYIPENGKIHIYDATGRQVLSQRLYYGHNHIDMSHLQPGLYLWTAEDDGVKIKSGKVVVNN